MQFTVNVTTLVDALAWVSKSLPVRPSAPVLAGVKMEVARDTLTLSGFDYEQSAIAEIPVESGVDGTVIVSGRLFAEIARALPKGTVAVTLDGTKLLVKAGSAKFSLQVMPVDEYPALPTHPEPLGSVDANIFAEAVRQVVPAAGRDDMLPVLTAVNVAVDPEAGTITLAATDRFRLAVKKVPFTAVEGASATTMLVPARTLEGWAKSLAGPEGSRFHFGGGTQTDSIFSIKVEGRSATARLLDGQYPNYGALIPSDFNSAAQFHAGETLGAIKRVALVAEKGTPCYLAFDENGMHISVAGDSEAFEEVDVEHQGAPVTIGFNIAYLQDGLNAIGAENATVSLVAASKPAVFRPAKEDDDFTYLLMPMRGTGG